MSNLTISYYLEKLITDPSFVNLLETQINDILKDSVINSNDIPKIVLIVFELIENHSSIVIKQNLLSDVINNLILFLVRKYNINITETELQLIDNIIKTSLNLLFTIPVFKKGCCC